MKLKIAFATLALSLTPGLALAMCGDHVKQSVSSCSGQQVWDAAKGECVTKPSA